MGWKFLASQRKHFESNLPHLDLNQFFPQQKLNQKLNPKIKHTEFQQIQQQTSKKCQLYHFFTFVTIWMIVEKGNAFDSIIEYLTWKRNCLRIQFGNKSEIFAIFQQFWTNIGKYLSHFDFSLTHSVNIQRKPSVTNWIKSNFTETVSNQKEIQLFVLFYISQQY